MRKKISLLLFVLTILTGCRPREVVRPNIYAVDAGGRQIEALEIGSSLQIGAGGLEPRRLYEFRLGIGEIAEDPAAVVSFARLTTDAEGNIRPFILWYQSGVVGCSVQVEERLKLPFTYQTFDQAEILAGSNLIVSVHSVQGENEERSIPAMELEVGKAIASFNLSATPRRSPSVYPSDEEGCLINSREVQDSDMFVSGRNFEPGEELLVSVVPNQRLWYVGDPINDVTGVGGVAAPIRVEANQDGRFTIPVWEAKLQRHGAYDIVAQRAPLETVRREVARQDIISFASDTAYLLFLRYPVGGPTMDIAGRPIIGSPYFQFADSFADTSDPVWGAVDPTYVPTGHSGGTYAAYYVVNHRDVNGWDPATGGATNLVDVTPSIEIMPVKAGCVNGTDIVIWNNPTKGDYDVVVDFGNVPASTYASYATDANYDAITDFLDGADQIGFVVAQDPLQIGAYLVGRAEYSQDDYFSTLFSGSSATNVDLRAVVRYPATSAGDNTPVAAGQYPIFIIEHGNHSFCEIDGGQTHASCPIASRTLNHKGYMNLLEVLASHGIIAVSIDAYDLTGWVPQWIPERGTLILKHLELWSHMNDTSTYTSYPDFFSGLFAGHVDMTRIQVSGHSRGGEASVAAYMLNTSFNINSVSSIAPVDGQAYTLPDVPYFVILPAADGDVSDLSGIRIYDRAGGGTDLTTKSGIHVYGANHNFFNTVWADDGDDSNSTRADYIPKANQQKIGEAYLAAFARIHLLNEIVYEDMLRGQLVFPSTAGYKIYHMRHEKNHEKVENGASSSATPSAGVTVTPVIGPSVHTTAALQVRWTAGGQEITFSLPSGSWDASAFEVLSFRVAQTDWINNPITGGQDFMVELTAGGVTKAFYASRFGFIPKPYDHPYYTDDHNVMTNIRIPLHSFIMNNSGLPLNNINTIRFRFSYPVQGEIYVDDVEFSR